jgi:hypothetical protein
MTKKSNSLIAALTLTAIALTIILLASSNRRAQAGMLNAQPSFSMMTTSGGGGNEALVIVDNESKKLIVYNLVNGNNLNVIAGYDLTK